MVQTVDQQLAAKAYMVVDNYLHRNDANPSEYKSFAKQFPTLIHTCGLCQAGVFAQSKSGTSKKVLDDFVQILAQKDQTEDFTNQTEDFVSATRKKSMTEYTVLSRRAMRAAEWLKRQADALIEGD
jgi:CRISPR-associated protein Cmr5